MWLYLLVVLPLLVRAEQTKEKFSEELFMKQTASGHVAAFFKFTTVWAADIRESPEWTHFNLFPRSLGEILAQYSVQELRLSLTQGLWRSEKWGYPVESAPPGALVLARFLPTVPDIEAAWGGLTNALAGLFCASLDTLDKTQAIEPLHTFHPAGVTGDGLSANASFLRYGVLPKENVCTENLTPWKKLLPCKSRRGLATLLSSAHYQKFTSYQSLALTIRPVCSDASCVELSTELSQSANLVFDPAIFNRQPDQVNWNVRQLFGIGVGPSCPLATNSMVYIDITDSNFSLDPAPQKTVAYGGGKSPRTIGMYDIKLLSSDGIKNIHAAHNKPHIYGIVPSPILLASRHVVGTGQERGGIVTTLRNGGTSPLLVAYLDLIPWYLRLYLHTLRIETNGIAAMPDTVHYRPGRDREKPYHLEVVISLPPRSVTTVRVDYEYSILRWTEYPPDANHGFYVGAAVITARLPRDSLQNATILSREDSTFEYLFWSNPSVDPVVSLFTESLLLTLPTPDFSMPYNVICLACTVAALAFGPLHNITTRTLVLVPAEEEEKKLLVKLLQPLTGAVKKIKAKFCKKDANKEESSSKTNEEKKDD